MSNNLAFEQQLAIHRCRVKLGAAVAVCWCSLHRHHPVQNAKLLNLTKHICVVSNDQHGSCKVSKPQETDNEQQITRKQVSSPGAVRVSFLILVEVCCYCFLDIFEAREACW